MNHSQLVNFIRNLTRREFQRLGGDEDVAITESILIRDGRYVGHRFCSCNLRGEWLVEDEQVFVYSHDGTLLNKCAIPRAPVAKAA